MRFWVVLAVAASLACASQARAYEQRSGTISFGVQAGVTGLTSGVGDFDAFELRNGLDGLGPGLAIRFRLSIDRASAFGISFESTNYERSLADGLVADFESAAQDTSDKIHATSAMLDYYRYFFRRAKDTPYFVATVGVYRPEIRFGAVNTRLPGSNLMFGAGVGVEHFFSRSVSLDLSYRAYGLTHDGETSFSSQLAVGLMFYHLGGRRRGP